MRKKLFFIVVSTLVAAVLLFSACGQSTPSSSPPPSQPASTAEPVVLKVGATEAPHAEILEQIKPLLAEQNITLDIVVFTDYVLPNTALSDGDLDANFFQHLPYLEDYNAKNNATLVSAAGIHVEPMGIYPGKQTSLNPIAEGALIGLPNDATNEGRALLLLQSLGLITLKEDAGLEATTLDIAENPHNLTFSELAAEQLPASLPDLDYAVINGNYAIAAGIGDTALDAEGGESPYVNIVAVRAGDEARPEIQALVKALSSDTVRTFINETYDGSVVPVF